MRAAASPQTPARLTFAASMDGSAVAETSAGEPAPLIAEGLEWSPGRLPGTKALRMRSAGKQPDQPPVLAYSAAGNLPRDCGTVMLWTKREWDFRAPSQPWRAMFATPMPNGPGPGRVGSGALWFWWWNDRLRADQSDARDRYRTWELPPLDGDWHHVAFTWRPGKTDVYFDGVLRSGISDAWSPMREALHAAATDRSGIDRFLVGCSDVTGPADSLIADLRIYDAPLAEDEVRKIFEETRDKRRATGNERPDNRSAMGDSRIADLHSRAPLPGEVPGTISPEALRLVSEWRASDGGNGKSPEVFRSVGPLREGMLEGRPYIEAGPSKGDRFAVRLALDPGAQLHLVEIDVPDDVERTEDLIVQPCVGNADYAMQTGLLLGGEYRNSGKMLMHRVLYWSEAGDAALVAMTARPGAPAAVAAVRAYAVKDAALPSCPAPEAQASGSRRHVALYYEDPALNLEFGLKARAAASGGGFAEETARLAATMRFAGADMLFYPGAWYQGLIGGHYNPRNHAPDYRETIYGAFDAAGLGFAPTVNLNNMPVPEGLVTLETMTNGALHASPIAIHDAGKPNPGGWHNTPPNFNVFHPDVQLYAEKIFDALVTEGAPHPSFRGICLHLTKHCLLWWGDETSGYNDYAIEAFCRDRGLPPPALHPDAQALPCAERGAAYAEWLRSDPALHESWIQWRCDQTTAFYARLAARLAAVRPDARLYLNSFVPADVNHPDFLRPDYLELANRRCGLDSRSLTSAIPNLALMQTAVPADYRWLEGWRYSGDSARIAAARGKQRDLDAQEGFWSLLRGAAYPCANQHDRYWESAIGFSSGSLSCDWLKECPWRVSTLDPAGDSTLRHFLLPLRHADVLCLSKGGFLVGTIGMEGRLAPFARAFKALPAVPMAEFFREGDVVARRVKVDGTLWGYVANTGERPATVEPGLPDGVFDAVTGEQFPRLLEIGPCELRAFTTAPRGRPGNGPTAP